ncbi:MAG: hypothetical protein D5R99_00045 [Methanocalculus sp. MSAO_Arc1]|nr:MAG: hypothetical protein D5R99_00045 [Methanocalculus sp. MSAO_Arc1]
MALVLLAMLWITQELMQALSVRKKLTLHDIVRIIKYLIPPKIQDALSVARTIVMNEKNRINSRKCKMKRKKRVLT